MAGGLIGYSLSPSLGATTSRISPDQIRPVIAMTSELSSAGIDFQPEEAQRLSLTLPPECQTAFSSNQRRLNINTTRDKVKQWFGNDMKL